jgi:hypothetical protein
MSRGLRFTHVPCMVVPGSPRPILAALENLGATIGAPLTMLDLEVR